MGRAGVIYPHTMVKLIFLELINSKCQRKDGIQFVFTEPLFVSIVVQALLEGHEKSLFRVFTVDTKDDWDFFEIIVDAEENDGAVHETFDEGTEIDIDWIFRNLNHYT